MVTLNLGAGVGFGAAIEGRDIVRQRITASIILITRFISLSPSINLSIILYHFRLVL